MFDLVITTDLQKTQVSEVQNGGNQLDLITLKGSFSTCDNSYKFEIGSNGNGKIYYPDSFSDTEEFTHEVEVNKLFGEIRKAIKSEIKLRSETGKIESSELENIAREITSERLEEVFWEEINQRLANNKRRINKNWIWNCTFRSSTFICNC